MVGSFRFGCRLTTLGQVVASVLGLLTGAGAADEPAGAIQRSDIDASLLVIRDFAGDLRIVTSERSDIAFGLVTRAADAARLDVDQSGGALTLDFAPESRVTLQTNGAPDARIAVAPAGEGVMILDVSPLADGEPAQMLVVMPRSNGVVLDEFVGSASIGRIAGSLDVRLISGRVVAEGAGEASLAITGSGEIELATVERRLSVRIDGAGDVDVAAGAVERIDAVLDGSGSIAFRGRSQTARVTGNGAGSIALGPSESVADVDVGPAIIVRIETP